MFYVPNEISLYLSLIDFPPNHGYLNIIRSLQCVKFYSWSPDEKALLASQFILTEEGKTINLPENIIIVGWLEESVGALILAVAFLLIFILLRRKQPQPKELN